MGYYTKFTLVSAGKLSNAEAVEVAWRVYACTNPDSDRKSFDEQLNKEGLLKEDAHVSDILNVDLYQGTYKWYDHEEDMTEIAKDYPDAVFVLYGHGEDDEDRWKEVYCGEKRCLCEAIETYEPMTPEVEAAVRKACDGKPWQIP